MRYLGHELPPNEKLTESLFRQVPTEIVRNFAGVSYKAAPVFAFKMSRAQIFNWMALLDEIRSSKNPICIPMQISPDVYGKEGLIENTGNNWEKVLGRDDIVGVMFVPTEKKGFVIENNNMTTKSNLHRVSEIAKKFPEYSYALLKQSFDRISPDI